MKDPERPEGRPRPRVRKLATAILKAESNVDKPKSQQIRPRKQPAGPPISLSEVYE